MENDTGSWWLFTRLDWHPTSHYLTLLHTSYADNLKLIKNNSHKDSVKTLIKLGHKLGQVEINQMVNIDALW